jgi:UDP-N-acetylmuramoyl-L-alanyl-D-glutamate--2,6-diaminopimelate ligase
VDLAPRAAAIAAAIGAAQPGDTVLIAGRGHETIQEVAGVDLPLDDRVEARGALSQRGALEVRSAFEARRSVGA